MVAELVRHLSSHASHAGKARLIYTNVSALGGSGLPWHSEGLGADAWTLADAMTYLGVDSEVTVETAYMAGPGDTLGARIAGIGVTMWEGVQVGVVGPNYVPLQNADFFQSFQPWEESGLGKIETAGFLRGGTIAWAQIALTGDPIEIRKGDSIRPFFFSTNGHSKEVGCSSGYNSTRIVCSNTRRIALREIKDENLSLRFKHTGDVRKKIQDVQALALKIRQSVVAEAEAYKYLAAVKVASEESARRFVLGFQGKKDFMSIALDAKLSRVEEDLIARFQSGIGNRGESFWDLVCAVDERLDHDLGNVKTGESDSDRVGRRLDNAWFGQGPIQRAKALDVALAMAGAVQPRPAAAVPAA